MLQRKPKRDSLAEIVPAKSSTKSLANLAACSEHVRLHLLSLVSGGNFGLDQEKLTWRLQR